MTDATADEIRRFTTSDGLSLAYRDTGTGLPVLCLPGLTRDGRDFDHLAPHLCHVRLIRLDWRGRGASDHDPNHLNYAVPVEARDVIELLDHLGIGQAAIIGTSRGGLVALTLGLIAHDRLAGVLFNDIGPHVEEAGLGRILDYLGRDPVWKTHEEAARELPKVSPGFANVPHERWLEEARRRWIETPEGLKITYDPKLRDAVLAHAEVPPPDLWPLYEGLTDLPLAVIRGAGSDILSRATVRRMRQLKPDLITVEVPDRGHVPFLDEPHSLLAIETFLERIGT